jgi:hypothetical protein
MSEIKDGGPAFPQPLTVQPVTGQFDWPSEWGVGGMSLRDWFAAHAPEQVDKDRTPPEAAEFLGVPLPGGFKEDEPNGGLSPNDWRVWWLRVDAVARYQYADAMLSARERKE